MTQNLYYSVRIRPLKLKKWREDDTAPDHDLLNSVINKFLAPHSPYKKSKSLISGGCVLDRRSFELMACSGYALSHVASAWGRRIPCECNWRNRPKIS